MVRLEIGENLARAFDHLSRSPFAYGRFDLRFSTAVSVRKLPPFPGYGSRPEAYGMDALIKLAKNVLRQSLEQAA